MASENIRSHHPTWRASQFMAAFVVLVAAVFLNLDGYHIGPPGMAPSDFFSEPPDINWTHGWPWAFLGRTSVYPQTLPGWMAGERMRLTSRWPFDATPISYFRPTLLVGDAFVLTILTIGTFYGIGQLPAQLRPDLRFSLKSLLAITTIVAIVLGLKLSSFLPRYVTQFIAIGIIILATIALPMALIVFLSRGLLRHHRA